MNDSTLGRLSGAQVAIILSKRETVREPSVFDWELLGLPIDRPVASQEHGDGTAKQRPRIAMMPNTYPSRQVS